MVACNGAPGLLLRLQGVGCFLGPPDAMDVRFTCRFYKLQSVAIGHGCNSGNATAADHITGVPG